MWPCPAEYDHEGGDPQAVNEAWPVQQHSIQGNRCHTRAACATHFESQGWGGLLVLVLALLTCQPVACLRVSEMSCSCGTSSSLQHHSAGSRWDGCEW